jgi:pimeloyl-ACP methyl ester carboxylesterase
MILNRLSGLIHDYMLPISDLAKSGQRAVIFYDQVGNGRSTRLRTKPVEFFTIDFFVAELENLVQKLGIASRFDVLGHSWGGILGLEYLASRQPPGLRRFVCSSTPACMARFYTEFPRLLSAFPKWVQEGMGMKKTDMARFRAANEAFDAVHTLTVVPFPKEHVDSMDCIWGPDADDTVGNAL